MRVSQVLAATLFFGLSVTATAADLARTPLPTWVVAQAFTPPPPQDAIESDYQDLYRDYQVNVDTQQTTIRYAFRFLTAKGIQNGSTLRFEYDPEYQSVELHTLTLWRDGQSIDQRDIDFRSLQRETGLEEAMYDGSQTWVGFLRDVRIDDVLEVGFTVRGLNPIFQNGYADVFTVQTSYPVDQWSLRLLAAPQFVPEVRAFGPVPPPTTRKVGNRVEVTMSQQGVTARTWDDNAPTDSTLTGRYILSQWKTWASVAAWALPSYGVQKAAAIDSLARTLTAGLDTPEAQTLALLTHVQDNIRYLGVEVGVNSHQPHPPLEVLRNGFGDCKDKAVLFTSLMASLGLRAWPVLVDTRAGQLVRDEGPTPLAFNHVIAAVETPQGTVFVDPTADHQGGALTSRSLGRFRYGLELKPGTTDLTPLQGPSAGRRELLQTYRFPSFTEPATVTMEYTFQGYDADDQRQRWDGADLSKWRKSVGEWLHDRYEGAQLTSGPQTKDLRSANEFKLSFEFTYQTPWELKKDHYEAGFYPILVGDNLYDPDEVAARTQPYALEHPITLHQIRRIELPADWNIAPVDKTLEGPGFVVTSSVRQVTPRLIEFTDELKSRGDRVPPDQWDEYLTQLKAARNQIFWSLTYQPEPVAAAPVSPVDNRPLGVAIIAAVLFGVLAASQGADF